MCGLKHSIDDIEAIAFNVTPFVGVWIETESTHQAFNLSLVTPFVGVWIETLFGANKQDKNAVTPFVGVWIETTNIKQDVKATHRHTLRGCVD